MAIEMRPCPHCGMANSQKRATCYHCQGDLHAAPAIPRRALHPRGATGTATPEPSNTAVRYHPPDDAALAQRAKLYREMQHQLFAGIPAIQALALLADHVAPTFRPVLRDMAMHAQQGGTLPDAFDRYPRLFPEWERWVIRGGQQTGNLPEAMGEIADTLEAEHALRTRISAETLYPKAVAWTALFVGLLLPHCWRITRTSFEPQVWRNMVDAALRQFALEFGLTVVLIILALRLWRLAARTRWGRYVSLAVSSRLPMVGAIIRNLARYRFCRILATLLDAGIAPMEALTIAAYATGDLNVKRLADMHGGTLGDGHTFTTVIERLRLLPPSMLGMVHTGEISGATGAALNKVADYYRGELEGHLHTLPFKVTMLFLAVVAPITAYLFLGNYARYFHEMFQRVFPHDFRHPADMPIETSGML